MPGDTDELIEAISRVDATILTSLAARALAAYDSQQSFVVSPIEYSVLMEYVTAPTEDIPGVTIWDRAILLARPGFRARHAIKLEVNYDL